jgi:hypothetical protein
MSYVAWNIKRSSCYVSPCYTLMKAFEMCELYFFLSRKYEIVYVNIDSASDSSISVNV